MPNCALPCVNEISKYRYPRLLLTAQLLMRETRLRCYEIRALHQQLHSVCSWLLSGIKNHHVDSCLNLNTQASCVVPQLYGMQCLLTRSGFSQTIPLICFLNALHLPLYCRSCYHIAYFCCAQLEACLCPLDERMDMEEYRRRRRRNTKHALGEKKKERERDLV